MKKPILGLCGPTGAGKGYILDELLKRGYPVERIVSYTTRKKRPNEINGVHYYFVSRKEFESTKDENGFFESSCWKDCYGTPKSEFERINGIGKIPVLEIGHLGMQKMQGILYSTDWELCPVGVLPGELSYERIQETHPHISISFKISSGIPEITNHKDRAFLIQEYKDLLRNRLNQRATETPEEISQRITNSSDILEFFLSGVAEEKGFKMISNTIDNFHDPIAELLIRAQFLNPNQEISNELKSKFC